MKKNSNIFIKSIFLAVAIFSISFSYNYFKNKEEIPPTKVNSSLNFIPNKNEFINIVMEEPDVETSTTTVPKSILEISESDSPTKVTDIVKITKPSVVGISSKFDDYKSCTGTGIIMSSDGYIITNAHVIHNTEYNITKRAESVMIVLSDETETSAKIIGADIETDLAVLKIDSENLSLTAANFGDSNSLLEGELAIAIGNPLGFELYGSTTGGIISALNRKITVGSYEMNLIQTDAAINPGNSGGPLINGSGQIIGINTSKIISNDTEGIGFAIPISDAKPIIEDLINYGYVKGRPLLEFSGEDITEVTAKYYHLPIGICVRFITPNSVAEISGLSVGDIITAIDETKVETMEEFNRIIKSYKAGEKITLTVFRGEDSGEVKIEVILDEKK